MSQPFLFKGKVQTRAFLPAPGMVREPPAREAVRGTSRYRCRGPRWRGPFFSGVPMHPSESHTSAGATRTGLFVRISRSSS